MFTSHPSGVRCVISKNGGDFGSLISTSRVGVLCRDFRSLLPRSMEKTLTLNRKLAPFIPLIGSLLMALVLVFIVEDFVQAVIVGPVLYTIWLLTLIVQSLPQGVLWAGFIVVMLGVAYTSFPEQIKPRSSTWRPPMWNVGQVEKWTHLLENTRRTRFSKWRLAQEMERLTRDLYAPLFGEGWKRVDLSRLELPAEIAAFFEARQPSNVPFWKRIKRADDEDKSALDLDPEVVIQYLEQR